MASTDILDAIKAFAPTYDSDVTVKVRGVSELKEGMLFDGQLPLRMIALPDNPNNPQPFNMIMLGTGGGQNYQIIDRLYIAPTSQQGGMTGQTVKLWRYMDSYRTIIRNNRGLSDSIQATIKGVDFIAGWHNWPEYEGGTPYYTMDVVLRIFEVHV